MIPAKAGVWHKFPSLFSTDHLLTRLQRIKKVISIFKKLFFIFDKSLTTMKPFLKIPKGVTIHHLAHSSVWCYNGILFITERTDVSADAYLSLNQIKAEVYALRQVIGDQKMCVLSEDRKPLSLKAKQKQFVDEQFNEISIAVGVVTGSAIKAKLTNWVLPLLNNRDYPIRYFLNEQEATSWLLEQKEAFDRSVQLVES